MKRTVKASLTVAGMSGVLSYKETSRGGLMVAMADGRHVELTKRNAPSPERRSFFSIADAVASLPATGKGKGAGDGR